MVVGVLTAPPRVHGCCFVHLTDPIEVARCGPNLLLTFCRCLVPQNRRVPSYLERNRPPISIPPSACRLASGSRYVLGKCLQFASGGVIIRASLGFIMTQLGRKQKMGSRFVENGPEYNSCKVGHFGTWAPQRILPSRLTSASPRLGRPISRFPGLGMQRWKREGLDRFGTRGHIAHPPFSRWYAIGDHAMLIWNCESPSVYSHDADQLRPVSPVPLRGVNKHEEVTRDGKRPRLTMVKIFVSVRR